MKNENFVTADLILASTLETLDFKLKDIQPTDIPGRYNFIFVNDSKIGELVDMFNTDKIAVEPKKYYYHMRSLKGRIFRAIETQKGG